MGRGQARRHTGTKARRGGRFAAVVGRDGGKRGEEDAPGKVRRLSVKRSRGAVGGFMFGVRLQNRGNRRSLSWPIRTFSRRSSRRRRASWVCRPFGRRCRSPLRVRCARRSPCFPRCVAGVFAGRHSHRLVLREIPVGFCTHDRSSVSPSTKTWRT